jgi:hypothetical protein
MNLRSQELFCAVLVSALLGSCAGPNSNIATSAAATPRFARAPADRPGLGTKWGETRMSRAGFVDFARADQSHPAATATIYYNDAAGIRAMAGAVIWRQGWPVLGGRAESLISIGIKDQSGRFLPGLIIGDRWFVVGEEGHRYSVVEIKVICDWRSCFPWTVSTLSMGAKHRCSSAVTSSCRAPISLWKVFVKAPTLSRLSALARCVNRTRTRNIVTRKMLA